MAEPVTDKRPRGRPALPADQRTRLVAVRLTEAQIAAAAALGGGDVSAGIRAALRDADSEPVAHDRARTP